MILEFLEIFREDLFFFGREMKLGCYFRITHPLFVFFQEGNNPRDHRPAQYKKGATWGILYLPRMSLINMT